MLKREFETLMDRSEVNLPESPNETQDDLPARRRIPSLDGIRGLAILIVVIHNASWILDASTLTSTKLLKAVTATGWIGVQLFFVLSGFLITAILLQSRNSAGYLKNFYIRRSLRIFPLYYSFLIIAIGITPLFADPAWTAIAHRHQWWLWTYMSNWASPLGGSVPGLSHLWSLAVEEQFYLVWPLIVLAASRPKLLRLCIALIVVTPILRFVIRDIGLPASAAYTFTIARWDALASGALLAMLFENPAGRAWLSKRMGYLGPAAIFALVGISFVRHGFHEDDLPVQVLGQSVAIVVFSWLVYVGVAPTRRYECAVRDLLSIRHLMFLGKYSYGIYIFHFPIHAIASHFLRDAVNGTDSWWRLLRWAFYVSGIGALSTGTALVSWWLLESRFLKFKERFAARDRRERIVNVLALTPSEGGLSGKTQERYSAARDAPPL